MITQAMVPGAYDKMNLSETVDKQIIRNYCFFSDVLNLILWKLNNTKRRIKKSRNTGQVFR